MDGSHKTERQKVGQFGENICCGYLEYIGLKIIERNFSTKFGELDIVAKSSDKTLIFLEVKTMDERKDKEKPYEESYPLLFGNVNKYIRQSLIANEIDFTPEDQMSSKKIGNFKKISEWYANKYDKLIGTNGYRLDLAAITLLDNCISLRYYTNIF
ncbi:MAG: YraN family protein [Candidatus Paceibacterota bacterium]|jgi:hypothetical protein